MSPQQICRGELTQCDCHKITGPFPTLQNITALGFRLKYQETIKKPEHNQNQSQELFTKRREIAR